MNCRFPDKPRNSQDIWEFAGKGEALACAMVNKFDAQQRCAYRKIRREIGEQAFREILCEALDILSRPNSITAPAAWLYWFLRDR